MATTSQTPPENSNDISKGEGQQTTVKGDANLVGLSPAKDLGEDKSAQFTDKAKEVIALFEGMTMEEIEVVLDLIGRLLPSRVRIQSSQ